MEKLLDLFIAYEGHPPHGFMANRLLPVVLDICITFQTDMYYNRNINPNITDRNWDPGADAFINMCLKVFCCICIRIQHKDLKDLSRKEEHKEGKR
jgi:hypothetical protein